MKKRLIWAGIFLLFFTLLQGQEKFRRIPPYPDPIKEWRLPRLEVAVLSNGLTVGVIPRPASPWMSLQLMLMVGESSSPENLSGLATLTARLMARGTTFLSSAEIEDRIESIGGKLDIYVSFDRTFFSFKFLKENLDEALSLLSQIILQPSLASSELDAVRRSLFYEIVDRRKEAESLAERQLLRWLFKGHPYERGLFNEDSLRLISRRDVQAFYNRYFRPEYAILVLGGEINLSLASRKVSHYFNVWKGENSSIPSLPVLTPLNERNIGFIDLPRAEEVNIVMGNILASHYVGDIYPLLVLNQVFGASPHSRLFMNLRETRQLAYLAFSQIEILPCGWLFLIQVKLPPNSISDALKEIDRELSRLTEEKIPAAEVEQAKSFLLESLPLELEPLEAMTRRAAEILALKLVDDYWNRWPENILTLEASRIMEVAQKLFSVPMSVVIVGNSRLITNFFEQSDKIKVYDAKGQHLYTISRGEEK